MRYRLTNHAEIFHDVIAQTRHSRTRSVSAGSAGAGFTAGVVSHVLPDGGQSWSLPVQTLLFLTLLGFIPALLLMTTSFTRIIIVLGLLRNALGTPSAPPNQVLLGLALFLTFS